MEDRKAAILKELDEKFSEVKQELGLESSLEDLDEAFFVKDAILDAGFVSESLSRQISHRLVDTIMGWNNYLHTIILPNPHSMVNVNESKTFDEGEKKDIGKLMTEIMGFVSTDTFAGVSKDKALEKEFIDGTLKFWNDKLKPELVKIMGKVNQEWKKK